MRQISICIPTWNRFELLFKSFEQVIDDERVHSIVIVDDCSDFGIYKQVAEKVMEENMKHEGKIMLYRNPINLDCYANKHESAVKGTADWCIIFDSDNILTTEYLDAIYAIDNWDKHTFYLPEFAKPHFSAVQWSGLTITKENVAQYADTSLATNLNAFNLFINRDEYLRIWDGSIDPITSDSIYFSYCWLNAGNKIYVTPNLQYFHRVGNHGSHYVQNQHKTGNFHEKLMQDIKLMK